MSRRRPFVAPVASAREPRTARTPADTLVNVSKLAWGRRCTVMQCSIKPIHVSLGDISSTSNLVDDGS